MAPLIYLPLLVIPKINPHSAAPSACKQDLGQLSAEALINTPICITTRLIIYI